MAIQPGNTLGPYEILSLIGTGGMGEVWRARDPKLARDVALKVLPAEALRDENRSARFQHEARAASALSHSNACHVYALGETEDGRQFIAMELVEGKTLRVRLQEGRLPLPEALRLTCQVAAALAAAHRVGIVHRDIKPENVMVRPDGVVKVLDFGLAKLDAVGFNTAGNESTHTGFHSTPGTVVGTVAYMSPEQARGRPVDARTDIWSCGVLLYELVAGRSPFRGQSSSDVLVAILDREPEPLNQFDSQTPRELQRIVAKALQKDCDYRYQSVRDLQLDVEALIEDLRRPGGPDEHKSGPTAHELAPTGSLPSHSTDRSVVTQIPSRRLLVSTAAIVLLAGVLALLWWRDARDGLRGDNAIERDITLRRLTANPASLPIGQAVISPDGRYLAANDSVGIQIRHIETGEMQRLPETKGMTVIGWTNDSTKVRASTCADAMCRAWTISLIGNSRLQTAGTWSVNDLVFALPSGSGLIQSTESGTLRVEWLDGSGSRTLGSNISTFSPTLDDTRLLVVDGSNRSDLKSVTLRDGATVTSWKAPVGWFIEDLVVVEGRAILVINKMDAEGGEALFELRLDASGVATEEPRRLTAWRPEAIRGMSASSDGKRVTFQKVDTQRDVYVADFDIASRRLSPPRRVTQDDSNDWPTTWTPDSRAIVFASGRNGTSDIWKQDITSDVAEPLIVGPGVQWWPKLTPEGHFFLYSEGEGNGQLLMRAPVTGGPGTIVGPTTSSVVHCKRAGRCVLSLRGEVMELDPLRGIGAKLASLPAGTQAADLLPSGDGMAVVVPAESGRRNRIRLTSFTGGASRDLVVPGADWLVSLDGLFDRFGLFTVNVSAQGRELLFVAEDGSARSLWKPTDGLLAWGIPSPDGKHLALAIDSGKSDVWMMSGF